jgi:hypothetical protein
MNYDRITGSNRGWKSLHPFPILSPDFSAQSILLPSVGPQPACPPTCPPEPFRRRWVKPSVKPVRLVKPPENLCKYFTMNHLRHKSKLSPVILSCGESNRCGRSNRFHKANVRLLSRNSVYCQGRVKPGGCHPARGWLGQAGGLFHQGLTAFPWTGHVILS